MRDYDYKNLDDRPKGITFWETFKLTVAMVVVFIAFCACVMTAYASPPDPWVRMTSPSGCSGGVIHSSREYGVWVVTAKHCSRRPGRVDLVFFKDGQRAKVQGQFVRAHPKYDCSVVWVSADNFYELPQSTPVGDGDAGPFVGQPVYIAGSYASGTIHPAVRHVAITSVGKGAYGFRLNDRAWGGHSGGPVVCATSGRLLGVLWGTGFSNSLITSNRAILETVYGTWATGQGMYSVHDDLDAHQVARKPKIDVSANRADLSRIQREVYESHTLRDHFDWDWDLDSWRSSPRIAWRVNGQRRTSDKWYGEDGFIWQYRQTGGQFT